MAGTYASFLLVLGAAAVVGQGVLAVCGRRRWSGLAPAVGLAVMIAVAWATVRLPGEGVAALIALAVVSAGVAPLLVGRVDRAPPAPRLWAVVVGVVLLGSLPFIVEARFGILGTGLNPDMSQHLFAVDRLVSGGSARLIESGYPLGPHALVVAISELGPNTVHAFDGLMLAVAAATCLAALPALDRVPAWRRAAAALLVGFAYLLASNYIQGAFKEAIEAMFLVAFAVALAEVAARGEQVRPLDAVPLAALAVGAVYAYSFPGLLWLAGTAAAWAAIALVRTARRGGADRARRVVRRAAPAVAAAVAVVAVAVAPEAGRMVEFARFETFDPDGAGLGNLFDRLSPLEALGIWPSGDFRVEPGDGAVPAVAFYLGAALALAALAYGLGRCWRRGDRALIGALVAATALWLYALVAGTPYQEAKALVIAAPIVMLIAAGAIAEMAPDLAEARRILRRRSLAYLFPARTRLAREQLVVGIAGLAFFAGAGISSVLALVNGPVGPSAYSPELAELRPKLGSGSILVVAPPELLADEHGLDYLSWELRGHRVCIEPDRGQVQAPAGYAGTVILAPDDPPRPEGTYFNRSAQAPPGPCPLIETTARADPAGDD